MIMVQVAWKCSELLNTNYMSVFVIGNVIHLIANYVITINLTPFSSDGRQNSYKFVIWTNRST